MNVINIYSIGKSEKDEFRPIEDHFIKLSSRYAKIAQKEIINREILKRQHRGIVSEIQESYSKAFEKYFKSEEYHIILDPTGKEMTTAKFAKIFLDNPKVNFFIGGAYGFERPFLNRGDLVLSISKFTMGHKIAKVVLLEQIYRALTINHNHPYHK